VAPSQLVNVETGAKLGVFHFNGDRINRFGPNLACKLRLLGYSCVPYLALIGEGGTNSVHLLAKQSVTLEVTNGLPKWAWSVVLQWKTYRKSCMAYQMAPTPVTLNDPDGHFSYWTLFSHFLRNMALIKFVMCT